MRLDRNRPFAIAVPFVMATALATACGGTAPAPAPAITSASTSARPAAPADWVTSVMPTAADLSRALGPEFQVGKLDQPPVLGAGDLRSARVPDKLAEAQCIGVIDPFSAYVYGNAPLRVFSSAMERSVMYGVAAMRTAEDARALFDRFSRQWLGCNGVTVIDTVGSTSFFEIGDVESTADLVSATVVIRTSTGRAPVPTLRALGVAQDCIVEVSVPVTSGDDSGDRRAVNLAQSMLAKVASAKG